MKKKLDTRFPAARIKKIMQADEDVGKIAMAVPLLVSKALELFLQDLCDRTYAITLKRGAKTLNSVHLKQCVQTFNVFDFLREIVGRAPDFGGSDATGDDRVVAKRRKVADGEDNSDEDLNRSRVLETVHTSSSGRGRGRVRGRGRPRGSKSAHCGKFEDDPDTTHAEKPSLNVARLDNNDELEDMKENIPGNNRSPQAPVHDFDLNADLDENGESKSVFVPAPTNSKRKTSPETKNVELPGWPVADAESMDIDPINLANLNRRIDDDEEDYDDED